MKKIFFMAVSAVLLAAGCQKTEIQNEVLPKIGFDTHMGKLTKEPDAEYAGLYDNLIEQDFRVWGYFATAGDLNYNLYDNYFGPNKAVLTDGIDVTVTSDTYDDGGNPVCNTGNATYYWPGKRKELDLYAVSLWNQTGDNVNNYSKVAINPSSHVLTVTDFFVNNAADDDLMVAPLIRQDQDDSEFVQPNFQHALTKVLVKFSTTAQVDDNGNTGVYVKSAKITNVKTTGTLTVTNDLPDAEPASGATLAEAKFGWELSSTAAPAEYTAVYNALLNEVPVVNGVSATTNGSSESAIEYDGLVPLTASSLTVGSWLLIPHEKTETNDTPIAGVELIVEYIIDNVLYTQAFDLTPANAKVDEWKRNMQTTYNVLIAPEYITFEPTVDEWDNEYDEERGDYSEE